MGATILLVEDELQMRGMVEAALSAAGFRVIATDRLALAWPLFALHKPDLAVTDLGLPDGSGLELVKKIRAHPERGQTPVIVLTVRSEFESKAEGFESGADQYLTKPIDGRELVLWARALLRRLDDEDGPARALKAGDCEIDVAAHRVRYRGVDVPRLTVKEFDLLYFLVRNCPKVLSRKTILQRVWRTIVVDSVVDTHLSHLRRKLPQPLADKIQSIPGKGFCFIE